MQPGRYAPPCASTNVYEEWVSMTLPDVPSECSVRTTSHTFASAAGASSDGKVSRKNGPKSVSYTHLVCVAVKGHAAVQPVVHHVFCQLIKGGGAAAFVDIAAVRIRADEAARRDVYKRQAVASSMDGSSIFTGWKRRSSAWSFPMYLRLSLIHI